MATISWSASQLYKLTGKPSYADIAAEYIRYTLDCQRTEPLKDKDGTRVFFYRDKSRKSIVHYIHQSREQVETDGGRRSWWYPYIPLHGKHRLESYRRDGYISSFLSDSLHIVVWNSPI